MVCLQEYFLRFLAPFTNWKGALPIEGIHIRPIYFSQLAGTCLFIDIYQCNSCYAVKGI